MSRRGFLDFGNHIHAGEARVPAFVRIERRDPHQAMHAALRFGEAVGILPGEHQRGALDPGGFTRKDIGDIHLPAARLGPALVHPHQHVGPVARFRAAGPGVDAENAVALVVRPVEENLQLQRIELLEDSGRDRLRVPARFWPGFRPARPRPAPPSRGNLPSSFSAFSRGSMRPLSELASSMNFWACSRLFQNSGASINAFSSLEPFLRARDVKETSAGGQVCPRRL